MIPLPRIVHLIYGPNPLLKVDEHRLIAKNMSVHLIPHFGGFGGRDVVTLSLHMIEIRGAFVVFQCASARSVVVFGLMYVLQVSSTI